MMACFAIRFMPLLSGFFGLLGGGWSFDVTACTASQSRETGIMLKSTVEEADETSLHR